MTTFETKAAPKKARRPKAPIIAKGAKKPASKARVSKGSLVAELVDQSSAQSFEREEFNDTVTTNRADATRLLVRAEAALGASSEQVGRFNLLLNEVSFKPDFLNIEQAKNSLRLAQESILSRDYDEARRAAGIGSRAFLLLSDSSRAQHLLLMIELLTVRATCSLHSKNSSDAKRCLNLMMSLQRKFNRAQLP